MKPRHAAALALVGWCLGITLGKLVPKNCPNCFYLLDIEAAGCVQKFETEAQCKIALDKWVQDYYVKADKSGELVVVPPGATCTNPRGN